MHHESVSYKYAVLHDIEHNMIAPNLNHHAKLGFRCIQILAAEHGRVNLVIEKKIIKRTWLGPG